MELSLGERCVWFGCIVKVVHLLVSTEMEGREKSPSEGKENGAMWKVRAGEASSHSRKIILVSVLYCTTCLASCHWLKYEHF